MTTRNTPLDLELAGARLRVRHSGANETIELDWPAVSLSVAGKAIRPSRPLSEATATKDSLAQSFERDGVRFDVSVTLSRECWFRKRVVVSTERDLPTPDFLEVDRQALPADGLRSCGYRATGPAGKARSAEEGAGVMPGCGYPLIGRRFFTGLEHPAGFNNLTRRAGKETIRLRHHPVWVDGRLQVIDHVFGWAEDARAAFEDYLDSIRLPMLKKPLVSFCTFWSDPYLGDLEYVASLAAYEAWFKAFLKLGLTPDVFTLDAGWFDRQSIFRTKAEVGGDTGLVKLRKIAESAGAALSLWVSHNGPVAYEPDTMRKMGFEVGGGSSATYSGDGYVVLLAPKFERTVERRFLELARKVGAKHFKMDWDNDGATNPRFDERYPTPAHVRQGSINAMLRIARKLREHDPEFANRHGWFPSPWWLAESTHVSLPDGGDCEYSALPSKTQRDAAMTHRDAMYFNTLQRDASALPLDCFDNHEFPDAPRNPFHEDPGSWVNAAWLAFLRGTTYITLKLFPESLEGWQVESLERVMAFCRAYADRIYTPRGRMVLGNPGRGEVYGFVHYGDAESWLVLRNPLAVPQTLTLAPSELGVKGARTAYQFYPHHELLPLDGEITLLAHEVKVVILSRGAVRLPFALPHQVEERDGEFLYRFAASETVTRAVAPLADPLQRVGGLESVSFTRAAEGYQWFLQTPCRMRECELQLRARGLEAGALRLAAFVSRYEGAGRGYAAPVTTVPVGVAGYGEAKNGGPACRSDEVFFSVPVPAGGRFNLNLVAEGLSARARLTEAWLAGYEAPSREAVRRKTAPARFRKCLPFQSLLGFGRTLRLPL